MELAPGLDLATAALLCAAALVTSALSAVVGMAGGITLLALMLLFLDPLVAIPVHGWIQLASNGARATVQRHHVAGDIVARYALLLLPGAALGLAVARALPEEGLRLAIGVFVLGATWRPGWLLLGAHPERLARGPRFVGLGAVAGVLNMTVIAPFFLGLGLSRQALVGTKAACQAAGHLAKGLVFGVGGFALAPWLPFLAAALAASVLGTWAGSRLLERVSERGFELLYKAVLTAIALRLVVGELPALLGAARLPS